MTADAPLDGLSVHDDAEKRRYEARLDGKVVGVITYRSQPGLPGLLTLVHTEIDPAYRGKGVGSRLVAGALEDIRRRGLSVVPTCPYVRAYIRRHPEQADLVAPR
jgi:predicted GNAT family acetyltransferase